MKIPLPQPASGRVIHRCDLAGGPVEVREDGRFRWLTADGGDIQSAMALASPSQLVLPNHYYMMTALGWVGQPQRVLNLGFGGGAFERFLRSVWPQLTLHSVESESGMVALARRFFSIPPGWAVDINDAFVHLTRSNDRYDLILVDVFIGQQHAASLYDEDFYAAVAQRLTAGGVAALNLAPGNDSQLLEMLLLMRPHFRAIRISTVPRHGNVVVLLSAATIGDSDFHARSKVLDRATGCDFATLCSAFHSVPAPAAVTTDQRG